MSTQPDNSLRKTKGRFSVLSGMIIRSLYLSLWIFLCGLTACDNSAPTNPTPKSTQPEQTPPITSAPIPSPTPHKEETVFEKAATGDIHATRYLVDQNRLEKDETKLDEIRKAIRQSAESGNHVAQLELNTLLQDQKIRWDEPAQALLEFEKKVTNDDPDAALFLHYFYKNGIGTRVDIEQSQNWLKKSTEFNHPVAQYLLGVKYLTGNGTEKKPEEAVRLIEKSANKDFPPAQAQLANFYRTGVGGLEVDYKKAFEFAVKADEVNEPDGSVELGVLHEWGMGVPKNSKKAEALFIKASTQGYLEALGFLALNYAKNDKYSKSLAIANEGEKKGDILSKSVLAAIYYSGFGVEKNFEKARHLATETANKESALGQWILGEIIFESRKGQNYKAEAVRWWTKAAEQKNVGALNRLGRYYLFDANKKDAAKSFTFFKEASDLGDEYGKVNVARAYISGDGVEKNSPKAVEILTDLSKKGNAEALSELAYCYNRGNGVVKNQAEALVYLYLSNANGANWNEQIIADLERRLSPQSIVLCQQKAEQIFLKQKYESEEGFQHGGASNAPKSGEPSRKLPEPAGSGILISKDGLIVTAYHVIENAKGVAVKTSKGAFNVRVLAADKPNDLVLLQIKDAKGEFTAAPLAPSAKVKLGQTVFTLGFPNSALQGFNVKMTKGEISSTSGIQDDPRQFQISVPVQPGNSGGALLDEQGNVIGIVVAKLSETVAKKYTGNTPENVNYAVKSSYVFPLVEQTDSKPLIQREQTPPSKLEDIVESIKDACVMVLVEE